MKRPTARDYSKVRKMRNDGFTVPQIAERLNRTVNSVEGMVRYLIAWGEVTPWRDNSHATTTAMRPHHWIIKRLREQGLSFPDIATHIGRSADTVRWIAIAMQRRGQMAAITEEDKRRIHSSASKKVWDQRREAGESLRKYTDAATAAYARKYRNACVVPDTPDTA